MFFSWCCLKQGPPTTFWKCRQKLFYESTKDKFFYSFFLFFSTSSNKKVPFNFFPPKSGFINRFEHWYLVPLFYYVVLISFRPFSLFPNSILRECCRCSFFFFLSKLMKLWLVLMLGVKWAENLFLYSFAFFFLFQDRISV